jgi:hypothetical protein
MDTNETVSQLPCVRADPPDARHPPPKVNSKTSPQLSMVGLM